MLQTFAYRTVTVSGPSFQTIRLALHTVPRVLQPRRTSTTVWAVPLSLATTRRIVSFPPGTKMFQFPGFPSLPYVFRQRCTGIPLCGFPHSGVRGSNGCTHLTAACRSVPRPSSALDAKASTVCS
jgi:hypothetical protein